MSDRRNDGPALPGEPERERKPTTERAKMMSVEGSLRAWPQRAEQVAFEALFERYYEPVYRLLYRLVGDEADDLAQEVFLRLYRRPPPVAGARLGAWLYRTASRLGYNALRAHKRWERHRDRLGQSEDSAAWQGGEIEPEAALEQREARDLARAALSRLNERQATLLALRAEGLSYHEAAVALGVAPSSVGTLLARAERAFQRAYQQIAEQAADQIAAGKRRLGGEP